MHILAQSLQKFIFSIKNGAALRLNNSGCWTVDNVFFAFFHRLLSLFTPLFTPLFVQVAEQFTHILDSLEEVPVKFTTSRSQSIDFMGYLEAAEAIFERLSQYRSQKAKRVLISLQRRIMALKYRLEPENGGWSKGEAFPSDILELNMHASLWKQKIDIFHYRELTNQDIVKLIDTAHYRAFTTLLLYDAELRNDFFTYALRDCLDINLFIQYPALQRQIFLSNLQGRIGRMGADLLKISRQECIQGQEKIVTLLFEGKPLNILNGQEVVHFRGNYELSINEVFDIFKNKNVEVGNLEIMANGISNWNVHKLGWWNADNEKYETVSLENKDWWKPLPLFEIIPKEEAKERYGDHLNGTVWNAAATSTRGSATLDYEQSHAYLELAIPIDHDNYAIYDFGKFALKFPSTFMESLAMFCHTVHATVAYPDENVYYTHRQHAQHSFALTRNQGLELLELIREDLIKARAGNFVYQIESENCAKWLHEKLENVVGRLYNLFTMKLLDTEPIGFVSWIFGGIRYFPKSWQVPILMFFHLLLGAYQETTIFEDNRYITKSLRTHQFWETGEVFLPAYLHKQLEVGVIGMVAALEVLRRAVRRKTERYQKSNLKTHLGGGGLSALAVIRSFAKPRFLSARDIFAKMTPNFGFLQSLMHSLYSMRFSMAASYDAARIFAFRGRCRLELHSCIPLMHAGS